MSSYMRLWERAATFLIKYLEKSEKPLGTITNIFPRLEFQTSSSKFNAPHLHNHLDIRKDDPMFSDKVLRLLPQLLHSLKI